MRESKLFISDDGEWHELASVKEVHISDVSEEYKPLKAAVDVKIEWTDVSPLEGQTMVGKTAVVNGVRCKIIDWRPYASKDGSACVEVTLERAE